MFKVILLNGSKFPELDEFSSIEDARARAIILSKYKKVNVGILQLIDTIKVES